MCGGLLRRREPAGGQQVFHDQHLTLRAVGAGDLVEERPHEEVASALGISVRRCKYLRMKLLARAATDPELRAALGEMVEA